jgi:DNA-binding response OmpR family regulator
MGLHSIVKARRVETQVSRPSEDPIRVAVLDDDARLRKTIALVLAGSGLDVQQFAEPEEVLNATKAHPFDAYVVDWCLDLATSESLVRSLRAQRSDPLPAVFLLTGNLSAAGEPVDHRAKRLVAECDLQFRAKPYSPTCLAGEIVAAVVAARGLSHARVGQRCIGRA